MDDVKIALEELKEESDSGALEATEPQIVVAGSKLGWFGVLVGAAAVTALGIAGVLAEPISSNARGCSAGCCASHHLPWK